MKVLIVDDVHPVLMQKLDEAGIGYDYKPEMALRSELLTALPGYTGLVVRTKFFIDREIMNAGSDLRWIARAGAGMDNIDEEYAAEKKITLINAPEGNRDAVAEHALGMLLNLLRNINRSDRQIREGIWLREENRGVELRGKTVGVIGYGNTGRAFAEKLRGFGVEVIAYDKYISGFGDEYVRECTLDILYQQADVVSLHIPLSPETKYWVNMDFFNAFHKPIYLVNTSRGQVLRTSDLVTAIENARVKGAALDVLENEKLSAYGDEEHAWFSKLKGFDNVVLTSHIAGWTVESYLKISYTLAEKILLLEDI